MSAQGHEVPTSAYIPDLHEAVKASAGQALPVGSESDGGDQLGVALQDVGFLARRGVPHAHRPVDAAAGEIPAIRAEAHIEDPASMPVQRTNDPASVCFPDQDGIVVAGTGDA